MKSEQRGSVILDDAPVDFFADNCDRIDVGDRHRPTRRPDFVETGAVVWADDPLLDTSENAAWLARHGAEAADAEQWLASVLSGATDVATLSEAEDLRGAVAGPGTGARLDAVPRERPQRKRSVTRSAASWVLFAIVCAGGWLALGPNQLRGPASYVVVTGDSMEPTYHDGDLVIGRKRSSYQVGDTIVYDPKIDADFRVIHRIIEIRPDGRYVTKGDNRDGADQWYPTNDDVFGSAWVRVPQAGSVIRIVREPSFWLAVTALILAVAAVDLLRRSTRPAADATANDREAGS